VGTYQNSTTGLLIELYLGKICVLFSGDGPDITGTTTILTNTWYNVAVSGTAGSYKLFINGTQEGSTYTGATSLASTGALYLGALVSNGVFYTYFNGYKQITKINNDSFSYPVVNSIANNTIDGNITFSKASRIQHVATSERAEEFFKNNTNQKWMFVLLGISGPFRRDAPS
jgi:hypothetical protein